MMAEADEKAKEFAQAQIDKIKSFEKPGTIDKIKPFEKSGTIDKTVRKSVRKEE